jgi:hypothetical protein
MKKTNAASIRARLKNHADSSKQDFNLTLNYYGLERLLYRLSISDHRQNFLLKGALLFVLWYDQPHRPTRDADLLAFGSDDVIAVVAIFKSICQIEVDDGIQFDVQSVKGSTIRKEASYGGVRIDIKAKLDGANIRLQIDIGYGDVVTPEPETINYPVLLAELAAPNIRVYPKYTVVAEKFQAICVLGMINSRMKDYFDLWILLRDTSLDPQLLRQAILATLARRQTPAINGKPTGLSEQFALDAGKQIQWNAFLRKNKLEALSFTDVVSELRSAFQRLGVIG